VSLEKHPVRIGSVSVGLLALLLCEAMPAHGQQYLITSIGGIGLPPTPAPALESFVGAPVSVAVHASGRIYFVAYNCVFSVDTAGNMVRVAGNSQLGGYGGDNGPATLALLNGPAQIAVDAAGNVYIADAYNNRIRKVDDDGNITTVAGTGVYGDSGDGGPALAAKLAYPEGVALDLAGNLYIADTDNCLIRKVGTDGTITKLAGDGFPFCGYSGDGGPAVQTQLSFPSGIAVDAQGNVFFTDGTRIRKVTARGTISTLAGTGDAGYSGDNGPAINATLNGPAGVAVDNLGDLYIADTYNSVIRKITPDGVIATVAGGSTDIFHTGDGGPATRALLWGPSGVAVDSSGNLLIADTEDSRIRKVASNGIIATVAGSSDGCAWGDGGPALASALNSPGGIALDTTGNLYIADNFNYRVRKIAGDGVITTVAGTGVDGYSGDGGPATLATMTQALGVAVGTDGSLYLADADNYRVRMVTPGGTIVTAAGTGREGYSGDGGMATKAQLGGPLAIAMDGQGGYYIIDENFDANSATVRLRRVRADGTIGTVANVNANSLAVGAGGDVFLASGSSILKVGSNGAVTTVAGTGEDGYSGDGGPATGAALYATDGVALDSSGVLYIADAGNSRIRKVDTNGIISTIAGTEDYGYSGDGGPATEAQLQDPGSMVVDSLGSIYLVDSSAIRLLVPEHTRAVLTATMTHRRSFLSGEVGATYQIVIGNLANAAPTTGAVSVRETIPSGLSLVSIAGAGWNCTGATCTRGDSLPPGSSFPPLTVTVNVAAESGPEVTNQAIVTGGGSPATAAINVTRIGSLTTASGDRAVHHRPKK
jgi:sugar lactone lactonase YvrE